MRINKYIANAGICSRRKADELIKNGNVKVNRRVMKSPGYDVQIDDRVEVNGIRISSSEKKVYLLLNKPVGYVTTLKDEFDRPTVSELMADVDYRLFPVGRLDFDTSGMLIMTNDGDFAYKVSHPKHHVKKTYRATVSGNLTIGKCDRLRKGVNIGDFVTSEADVEIVREVGRKTIIDITVHEGKYHQVRRMFEAIGCKVIELERIAIGEIKLGRLAVGGYRKLTRQEIDFLTHGR